ncbi:class I SAM-dependent methyltransferase [Streptomyces huasconensis]|uniref:class I SAM-dependent methyltransferase n=1 Tax=Streptomyces TaxID=1883 RepID=UPI0038B5A7AF|nr:class I SAM-dependent methyltransferase [Streptomyces huasconensis]
MPPGAVSRPCEPGIRSACRWPVPTTARSWFPATYRSAAPSTLSSLPVDALLARKSLALLNTSPGNVVLDAACGRGHTTACLAEKACHALGADIQPQQIERARERFGHRPHVSFAVADLTRLREKAAGVDLTPGCIDRVHCLEAAFHFGPAGRRAFLAGNHRVLRPGGRLVLVDFTWPDTAPWTLAELDSHRLVRETWKFEDFATPKTCVADATTAGFNVRALRRRTTRTVATVARPRRTRS